MIYVPRQTLMDNVDTDEELRLYRRGWPWQLNLLLNSAILNTAVHLICCQMSHNALSTFCTCFTYIFTVFAGSVCAFCRVHFLSNSHTLECS